MQAEGSTPPANLEPDWRVPYLDYFTRGDLPSDKTDARWITRRAKLSHPKIFNFGLCLENTK
jgi:hypothetical protein